jgi:hypothetical protein
VAVLIPPLLSYAMAESDPEYIKAVSEEHMPNFICNLCSRHSNFEFFLRGSSDVDSHTRGRQHQQKLGDVCRHSAFALATIREGARERKRPTGDVKEPENAHVSPPRVYGKKAVICS